MRILLNIWKFIRHFIAFFIDIVAILFLGVGSLIWALALIIKAPKDIAKIIDHLMHNKI